MRSRGGRRHDDLTQRLRVILCGSRRFLSLGLGSGHQCQQGDSR